MAPDPQRVQAIFLAAIDQSNPAERAALLTHECGDDAELRGRVEALLHAHDYPLSFLEAAVADMDLTTNSGAAAIGTQVGAYKLLQQIGEGGFGVVYMAEQLEPVRRKVALKVIKPGMDTRQVIARFEAERQALAVMDHPNIAHVLEAGTIESGRPYFVMELVRGVPITQYCDNNELPIRERLTLFATVCQAIQHAHTKGIIHRDIKPTNVLVTRQDGNPVVKVIDFGVAKAMGQQLTEKTLFTEFAQMIGTPLYMSPEQAELSSVDIDTRSDIYSLGVLLYELLTGSTPVSKEQLKQAAFDEIRRIIREEDPPKPSTRLSTAEAAPSIAAQRHTEPAKLTKMVRGELDWIVMKALEKDRGRRYETASSFAKDIALYLNDEPVLACPPSAVYRLRKFVRRHRGQVLTASLVLLALLIGIVGTTWGMIRATYAEADAVHEAGEKSKALVAKEAALSTAKASEIQAKAAQKDAQENLKDALAAVEQMLTRVAEDKLVDVPQMEPIRRDLLLEALKFYQKFLDKQSHDPVIRREAALAHWRVGRIHHHFGQYQDAEVASRKAIELFDKLGTTALADPDLHRQMVYCHLDFAVWTLSPLGKGEEAMQNIRRAVELADKLDKQVPDNRTCIFNARHELAMALTSRQPEEAEKILQENLPQADDVFLLEAVHRGLGDVFVATRRLPQAEESYRQAVKCAEEIAGMQPAPHWVLATLANLKRTMAGVIAANQRPAEAEEIQRSAILILDRVASDFSAGPHHRTALADALFEHAVTLKELKRPADAEAAVRRAVEIYEKLAAEFPALPRYHHFVAYSRINLGQLLTESGRIAEASRVYHDAGPQVSKLPTTGQGRLAHSTGLALAQCELGRLLEAAGKMQEADAAFGQVVTVSEKLEADFGGQPEYRRELAHSHANTARQLGLSGRHADADRFYALALLHFSALARESPADRRSQEELARFHILLAEHHLWRTRRPRDAQRSIQAALEGFDKLAQQFPDVLAYRARVADCQLLKVTEVQGDGGSEQAVQRYRKEILAAEAVLKDLPTDLPLSSQLGKSYRCLAQVLGNSAEPAEVERALTQSMVILDKVVAEFPSLDAPLAELSFTCRLLAEHSFRSGRTDEAWRFYGRVVELWEQLLAAAPNGAVANDVWWLNSSAWFLVRREGGSPRSAQLAVDLARRAVAKEPKGYIVNTLGTALYRAGQWQEAIEALQRASQLQDGQYVSHNAFFIAMAHWQVGEKDEAQAWYEKAVQWMEANAKDNELLIRFRAEADKLMK